MALSYRPEIWAAALRMYLEFPVLRARAGGVLPTECHARVFEQRIADERGRRRSTQRIPADIGRTRSGRFGPFVVHCDSVCQAGPAEPPIGSRSTRWQASRSEASTRTHCLVRELLMLSAVFAGSYFWEVQTAASARWRPPVAATTRCCARGLLVLACSLIEVALSFGRFPFTYGLRCREVHPLGKDGWTKGPCAYLFRRRRRVRNWPYLLDRPDLDRRPLDLDLSILSGSGSMLGRTAIFLHAARFGSTKLSAIDARIGRWSSASWN